MQNTPMGCGSHLSTILGTFTNDPKSRSENNSLKCSDLGPEESDKCFLVARTPASRSIRLIGRGSCLRLVNWARAWVGVGHRSWAVGPISRRAVLCHVFQALGLVGSIRIRTQLDPVADANRPRGPGPIRTNV
jgi:hypothetical protein